MWQHLINIGLGLGLVILALGTLGLGTLMPVLAGMFSLLGAGVAILSLWGCFDRIEKEPHLEPGIESDM